MKTLVGRTGALMGLALVVCALASLTRADEPGDPPARLRSDIERRPTEAGPRCELAFALVQRALYEEAVAHATAGIALARPRNDARGRQTLGACLYNRGRAHEGLGHTKLAITDYADSLDLRPNATVRARLLTLMPNVPEDAPLVALLGTLDEPRALPEGARARTVTAPDGTRFSFVADDRGPGPGAFAVARLCGEPRVAQIDESYFDNYGSLTVENATARTFGDVKGVLVDIGGAGDVTCGRMDGVIDGQHEASVVVFADGCAIRAATFVRIQTACDEQDEGLSVRFDDEGYATTTRRRHLRPARLGRFRLRDIAD